MFIIYIPKTFNFKMRGFQIALLSAASAFIYAKKITPEFLGKDENHLELSGSGFCTGTKLDYELKRLNFADVCAL